MKVAIRREYLPGNDIMEARAVASMMEDTTGSSKEYASMAASAWLQSEKRVKHDSVGAVLRAQSYVAGNARLTESINGQPGMLDVWTDAIVKTYYGYLEIGFYMTDVWALAGREYDREPCSHMYVRYFTEA